jgi:hypothetical protein
MPCVSEYLVFSLQWVLSDVSECRQGSNVDLRDLLALSVEAAVQGGKEVRTINSYVSQC